MDQSKDNTFSEVGIKRRGFNVQISIFLLQQKKFIGCPKSAVCEGVKLFFFHRGIRKKMLGKVTNFLSLVEGFLVLHFAAKNTARRAFLGDLFRNNRRLQI